MGSKCCKPSPVQGSESSNAESIPLRPISSPLLVTPAQVMDVPTQVRIDLASEAVAEVLLSVERAKVHLARFQGHARQLRFADSLESAQGLTDMMLATAGDFLNKWNYSLESRGHASLDLSASLPPDSIWNSLLADRSSPPSSSSLTQVSVPRDPTPGLTNDNEAVTALGCASAASGGAEAAEAAGVSGGGLGYQEQ